MTTPTDADKRKAEELVFRATDGSYSNLTADGFELCDAIATALAEERERAVNAVPATWLDNLLSGPSAVLGKPPWGCPNVERLLSAIKERIRTP